MKKMKKILAFALAMVMMFAMNVTVFADTNKATITVTNADDAQLSYALVIQADQTTETGWSFASDAAKKAFTDAYNETSEQKVIQAVISGTNNGSNTTDAFKVALSNATANCTFASMSNPQEVSVAGLYVVKATEEGYTFNNMAAFVGFGYDNNGAATSLVNTELVAKKAPTSTDKTADDADAVTEIGKTLNYTVSSYFAYIPANATEKFYGVYDVLTGASYDKDSFEVVLGTTDITEDVEVVFGPNDANFFIDLSDYIDNANTYAGVQVTVTYSATVTGTQVNNKAIFDDAEHTFDDTTGWKEVNDYTGSITLTKYGQNEDTLAGAGFIVSREDGKYAKFDDSYVLVEWVDEKDDATEVVTGADGTLTVSGLDLGTYFFTEVTAPEGYSVNTTPAEAVLALEDGTEVATATVTAATSMTDTKLSALPATGGIGTTIFTIAGVAIMVIAAGLFFATRRKNAR